MFRFVISAIWTALFGLLPASPASGTADRETLVAIRTCRELARRCQLADGGFRMSTDGEKAWIVPYFGNIAAMALLSAHNNCERAPDDLLRVKRWLQWYAAHQAADGTIDDYFGTIKRTTSTGDRDSTDSYASTFLQTIWRYWQATHDENSLPSLRAAAAKALDAIALTTDPRDGLTFAKPGYPTKYVMDNVEVCVGLDEGAQFFAATGAKAEAARARQMLERSRGGLARFWSAEAGCFAWAMDAYGGRSFGLSEWYPEAVVALFTVAHVDPPPPALWDRLKQQFEEKSDAGVSPDWWLRAALRVTSPEDQTRYRQAVAAFVHRMAREPQRYGLNRFGLSLFTLAGGAADWSSVRFNYDDAPAPTPTRQLPFDANQRAVLPWGIGPLPAWLKKSRAEARLNGGWTECRFELRNEGGGCAHFHFPWEAPMDLSKVSTIICNLRSSVAMPDVTFALGFVDGDGDIWEFPVSPSATPLALQRAAARRNAWSPKTANGQPDWNRIAGYRLQAATRADRATGAFWFFQPMAQP